MTHQPRSVRLVGPGIVSREHCTACVPAQKLSHSIAAVKMTAIPAADRRHLDGSDAGHLAMTAE
jgi:hypothetical protein